MTESQKPSSKIRREIISVREALLLAISGACGVSLLSTAIATNLTPWLQVSIGSALVLVTISGLLAGRFRKMEQTLTFESVIAVDTHTGDIWTIPGYRFSMDATRLLRACFIEDETLRKDWQQSVQELSGSFTEYPETLNELAREVAEHLAFSQLATTMSDELLTGDFKFKHLKDHEADDITDIRDENRITKLVSQPVESRPDFQDFHTMESTGKLFAATTETGNYFERLSLPVPRGSKIYRDEDNSLVIRSRYVQLKIQAESTTFSGVHGQFLENYVGLNPYRADLIENQIYIDINFRRKLLRTKTARLHLDWAERVISELREYLSFEDWLHFIGWEQKKIWLHTSDRKIPRPLTFNRLKPDHPSLPSGTGRASSVYRVAPDLGDLDPSTPASAPREQTASSSETKGEEKDTFSYPNLELAAEEAAGLKWIEWRDPSHDSERFMPEQTLILQGILWVAGEITENKFSLDFANIQRNLTLGEDLHNLISESCIFGLLPLSHSGSFDEEFLENIVKETQRIRHLFATSFEFPENLAQSFIIDQIFVEAASLVDDFDLKVEVSEIEELRVLFHQDFDHEWLYFASDPNNPLQGDFDELADSIGQAENWFIRHR